MEGFSEYGHALAAMSGVAVLLLLLSPLSAMRKQASGVTPGAQPAADYSDSSYRWHRTYANLTEAIGPFAAVTLAAILAGANPFWVNLLASLFLVIRLVVTVVHITGVGKPVNGMRSFIYIAGWASCLGLAYLAIKTVLFGG